MQAGTWASYRDCARGVKVAPIVFLGGFFAATRSLISLGALCGNLRTPTTAAGAEHDPSNPSTVTLSPFFLTTRIRWRHVRQHGAYQKQYFLQRLVDPTVRKPPFWGVQVLRAGGPTAFWRGFAACCVRCVPQTAATMGVFELLRRVW